MSSSNQALKNLLDLILDGISVGADVMKDGKINLVDLPVFMKLIPDLGPAIGAVGQIPSELSHLSEADAQEIVSHVMGKLSIGDAHAILVIGTALKAAVAVYSLVMAITSPPAPPQAAA